MGCTSEAPIFRFLPSLTLHLVLRKSLEGKKLALSLQFISCINPVTRLIRQFWETARNYSWTVHENERKWEKKNDKKMSKELFQGIRDKISRGIESRKFSQGNSQMMFSRELIALRNLWTLLSSAVCSTWTDESRNTKGWKRTRTTDGRTKGRTDGQMEEWMWTMTDGCKGTSAWDSG